IVRDRQGGAEGSAEGFVFLKFAICDLRFTRRWQIVNRKSKIVNPDGLLRATRSGPQKNQTAGFLFRLRRRPHRRAELCGCAVGFHRCPVASAAQGPLRAGGAVSSLESANFSWF